MSAVQDRWCCHLPERTALLPASHVLHHGIQICPESAHDLNVDIFYVIMCLSRIHANMIRNCATSAASGLQSLEGSDWWNGVLSKIRLILNDIPRIGSALQFEL